LNWDVGHETGVLLHSECRNSEKRTSAITNEVEKVSNNHG
jgi:hypothetical protein